ncbi:MAG: KamA family radical SAM protein [Deferribacteraceae bacterium]|jgi:lysine 2,3-aminomutase|nr:KamA family radical SAM protein [Deferribacteraceae bacterium]
MKVLKMLDLNQAVQIPQRHAFGIEASAPKLSSDEASSENCEPPSSPLAFRKQFYPKLSKKDWNSWQWQLSNRITDIGELERFFPLTASEKAAAAESRLPFAVTPYYISLMNRADVRDPLRRCMVPSAEELVISRGEAADPLAESRHEAAPRLIHRYPDRALLLATDFCSAYCRYCTRSRLVGQDEQGSLEEALEYIRVHTEIRDVLVSGGDPLTLADCALERILSALRVIPHVEIIRIGTKVPMVLPQRITASLVKILKRYHPLFISIHTAHPQEITPEAKTALERLAGGGIPLGSQTVLLKGVNDSVAVMKNLMHKLLMARVRPYYLYQCDPVKGTSHFRTSVAAGLEIIANLRGFTSGYAVPTFVVDAPGGGGKIPIQANNICGESEGDLFLMNYEGNIFKYPQVI